MTRPGDTRNHERLSPEESSALSAMVREARAAKGWSRERLSVEAENAIRARAADFQSAIFATTERRQLWRNLEITGLQIFWLENRRNAIPLGTAERRARLLGICLALGLDLARVNQICGGL